MARAEGAIASIEPDGDPGPRARDQVPEAERDDLQSDPP
jgi:hypothetical protein